MTKSKKVWLGIFTFMPIVLVVAYLVLIFGSVFLNMPQTEGYEESSFSFRAGIGLAIACILLAVVISLALLIIYIIHVNNNPKLDSNQKLMWILIILLAQGIGHIVYYFVEIIPSGRKITDQTPH
ncbi:MAG: hypothetical protein HKO54_01090 [Flavobacteriaceae bacterium]|nr:hypothetical protein [Flavobacteriaceae bacterium]